MNNNRKIRVGSRRSELALIQTEYVISMLKVFHPEKEFEIVTMSTLGDKIIDIPLPKIGEKSLFTKELEMSLSSGEVDFLVHSLKDLPTTLPPNMAIGAVLKREDARDALVLHKDFKDATLEDLPKGSVIGTSSLRRTAQLSKRYPHLKVTDIRGNLNTRLKKLDEFNNFQGIVLAAAGLQRMNWDERISKFFDSNEMLYAVGQGALAVECKQSNDEIISLLKPLYHLETALCVVAERMFLRTLGGGCSAPVGVWTGLTKEGNTVTIKMKGAVWSLDGRDELFVEDECVFKLRAVENKEFEKESTVKNGSYKRNCEDGIKIEMNGSSNKQKLENNLSSGDFYKIDAYNCEEISCKKHEPKSCVTVHSSKEDSDASAEINNPSKKQKLEHNVTVPNSSGRCPFIHNIDVGVTVHSSKEDSSDAGDEITNLSKIQKLDHNVTVPDSESSKTDSSGRCPVIHDIGIGEDFMGKCPIPESHIDYLDDKNKLGNFTKCPFSKCFSHDLINNSTCPNTNETTSTNCCNSKQFEEDEMFSAVVPIDGVSIKTYKEVAKLGYQLAENLKNKGAVDMITKSQNVIRNN